LRAGLALCVLGGPAIASAQAQGVSSLADRIQWHQLDRADLSGLLAAQAVGETFPVPSRLGTDWTSDTVSLLVYAEAIGGLVDIGDVSGRSERPNGGTVNASFVLPGADRSVSNGSYSFDVVGTASSANVTLIRKRGSVPASGSLDLNLFVLDGSKLSVDNLNRGLAVFQEVYAKAGLQLGALNGYNVTGAQEYLEIDVDDDAFVNPASPLRQLVKEFTPQAPAQAVNLFFVRSLGDGLFGISLGLPGSLGIPGTTGSGVVISVSAHEEASGFDVRNFGQTMSHESGHFLGLYHTSESDGSLHDTISDTPECAATGGQLAPSACADGQNFMFWAGVGFDVSAGQKFVLLRCPIVK
jgi:hypothetical protein